MLKNDKLKLLSVLSLILASIEFSASKPAGTCEKSTIELNNDGTRVFNIRFPKIATKEDDTYLCTQFNQFDPNDEHFILKFKPAASQENIHHMILYGCYFRENKEDGHLDNRWQCGMGGSICGGGRPPKIVYAWARDAEELQLPADVGFRVGSKAGISSLVLQVHYKRPIVDDCSGLSLLTTSQPQKNSAGIFLLGSSLINVPPGRQSSAFVNCRLPPHLNQPLHVFAFRTHTHNLGLRVSAYRVRVNGGRAGLKMIGSGNPLWPEAFYPRVGGSIDLRGGDELMARCDYARNEGGTTVRAGMTGGDEMCNFYMMYFTPTTQRSVDRSCWNEESDQLRYPVAQQPPYPGYAGLDSMRAIAKGEAVQPAVPPTHHHHHKQHGATTTTITDNSWPEESSKVKVGQVGGVSLDEAGRVHVFHRAQRVWDYSSFTAGNVFSEQQSPIVAETVLVLGGERGELVDRWGGGIFFMPHGITVVGNHVWLTDVALHQVMKYPVGGSDKALITLGERFKPGNDEKHFCKPTSVAVDADGNIYVGDGYCNSRIVNFDPTGRFVKAWGKPTDMFSMKPAAIGHFAVVHDVKFVPLDGAVCAADRENGRVQCFDPRTTAFLRVYGEGRRFGETVYAIDYRYDGQDGLLYLINHEKPFASGYTLDYKSGNEVERWPAVNSTHKLTAPHSFAVSADRRYAYVGMIEGERMLTRVPLLRRHGDEDAKATSQAPVKQLMEYEASEDRLMGEEEKVIMEAELKPLIALAKYEQKMEKQVADAEALTSSSSGGVIKNASYIDTKNLLVLTLLVVLPLVAVVLTVFYFVSRNRQMDHFKRLMYEENGLSKSSSSSGSGGGGKLNIGSLLSSKNSHKYFKVKSCEEDAKLIEDEKEVDDDDDEDDEVNEASRK